LTPCRSPSIGGFRRRGRVGQPHTEILRSSLRSREGSVQTESPGASQDGPGAESFR
jgi:hypothetical protein